jgi:hypothetical protein
MNLNHTKETTRGGVNATDKATYGAIDPDVWDAIDEAIDPNVLGAGFSWEATHLSVFPELRWTVESLWI